MIDASDDRYGQFHAMRHAMVASQLRTNAVSDPRVVAAMARGAARGVPAGEPARARLSRYGGAARRMAAPQNVPIATGRLLTEAQLAPDRSRAADRRGRRLYRGGAGAVASPRSGRGRERPGAGSDRACRAGGVCQRSTLVEGPLDAGRASAAPYDVLVIDGAVEHVPDALVDAASARWPRRRRARSIAASPGSRRARSEGGFGLLAVRRHRLRAFCPGFARPKAFTF